MSATHTTSSTFTVTHARHLASKIAADLHLCALYYDSPTESEIVDYTEELAVLLRDGYVSQYEFGFKRNDARVVCWRYVVHADRSIEFDDNAGKVCSFADTSGATFYNFLSWSAKWYGLPSEERSRIRRTLPIQRTSGLLPSDGEGYWDEDRGYCSGGVRVARSTFRPLS